MPSLRAGPSSDIRRRIWIFRGMCLAIVAMGVAIAVWTGDQDWVERSGTVVTAASLLLTYAQFRFEVGHQSSTELAGRVAETLLQDRSPMEEDLRSIANRAAHQARLRIDEMRRYFLLNALIAVAFGELVNAFGGLLFALVMR